jgi:archaeal flagellar protein FlaJ
MALKGLQRTWYRMLGPMVRRRFKPENMREGLSKARVQMHPDAYLANMIATALLTFFISMMFAAVAYFLFVPRFALRFPAAERFAVVVWLIPFLLTLLVYAIGLSDPGSKSKKRSKDINLKLPYALNYIAAMASAGVIPTEIFRSLAKQRIYGEVANEAARIYKDLQLHGKDIVTALRRAIDRSPSTKFQEFLQGAITTITSGGDLRAYFLEKAARYQFENRQEQKAFIDTMGLMAETYVTVAVAGPLFLIVMMAIIGIISGGGVRNLQILTYLLLPVINAGYVFLLKAMIPEV